MGPYSVDQPYPSRRSPLLAKNVVATSQPLAAQAGLRMLLEGGNAVDAAVAAAIALTVVEPTGNGAGSDAFAIVWDGTDLHGLNASGRSPEAWTRERFADAAAMPARGWDSVTVPGAVSAWVALAERFGRRPFETLFEPAIAYARQGFAVSPVIASQWARISDGYRGQPGFDETFLPGGRPPAAGQSFANPKLADTLKAIAASRGEAFYRGDLAQTMADHAAAHGGALTREDLAAHQADWCGTIEIPFAGLGVHEIPPNGQGIATLIALGLLAHVDLAGHPADSPEALHLQIEAMKLGLADADAFIGDPDAMPLPVEALLNDGYLSIRAKSIDPARAGDPGAGAPHVGGTVYISAADAEGTMVSFIQSNYQGFGSGVAVPGTGISLQNRGAGFTLQPGHPNEVGPRKRPFHTIIPGFAMKGAEPAMSFGVMGGPMQAQGHLQLLVRTQVYGQNPQTASDAPRWRIVSGRDVAFEHGTGDDVIAALAARGHKVTREPPDAAWGFGGAQIIARVDDYYLAASDHRKDGQAVGY